MKITSTQSLVLIGQFAIEALLIGFLLYLFVVARSQYRTNAEHFDCPLDNDTRNRGIVKQASKTWEPIS